MMRPRDMKSTSDARTTLSTRVVRALTTMTCVSTVPRRLMKPEHDPVFACSSLHCETKASNSALCRASQRYRCSEKAEGAEMGSAQWVTPTHSAVSHRHRTKTLSTNRKGLEA